MDTNEILTNEEVVEAAEDTAISLRKCWKVGIGIGVAGIAGVVAYRYAVKPMLAKWKAKREQKKAEAEEADDFVEEVKAKQVK